MKKLISALLLFSLIICSSFALYSCEDNGEERLSGTYEGNLCTLKFKGERVTAIIGENQIVGEYDIDTDEESGEKTISLDFGDSDEDTNQKNELLDLISAILTEDLSFTKNEGAIKIGFFTFIKK